MSSTEFRPIFIVGFPRSGTTLLATHLDRHSRIAVPPESQFFLGVLPCGRPAKAGASHAALIKRLFENRRIWDLNLDREDVSKRFQGFEPEYKNLLRVALESYTSREGKPRPGEKSPDHLLYVPLIMEWYPSAKVICIVRDGRDVVQSLMKVPWYRRKNLAGFCAEWNYQSGLVEEYQKVLPVSFHVVKFEDFIRSPEVELKKICVCIGEDYEPSQLDTNVKSKLVTERESGWKSKAATGIDSSRAGAWENASEADKFIMNRIMRPWLHHWGYQVPEQEEPGKLGPVIKAGMYSESIYKVTRYIYETAKLILCRLGLKDVRYRRKQ